MEAVYGARARRDAGAALAPRSSTSRSPRPAPRAATPGSTATSPAAIPTTESGRSPTRRGSSSCARSRSAAGRARLGRLPPRATSTSFAFQSMTTSRFVDYLKANLYSQDATLASRVPIDAWVYGPGVPAGAAPAAATALARVDTEITPLRVRHAGRTARDRRAGSRSSGSTSSPRCRRGCPKNDSPSSTPRSDSPERQSEILSAWFMRAIAADYQPAWPALEAFLTARRPAQVPASDLRRAGEERRGPRLGARGLRQGPPRLPRGQPQLDRPDPEVDGAGASRRRALIGERCARGSAGEA